MNKRGLGFLTTILIFLALTIGMIYTAVDQSGLDKANFTDTFEVAVRNATSNVDFNISLNQTPELGKAVTYYGNGVIMAYGELSIWLAHFVQAHPTVPYRLLIAFFLLSFVAPVLLVLFKILVILFLLIKEFIQSKKEKRRRNGKKV